MLKCLVGEEGFYNRKEGPKVILTDNCDELRSSLSKIWPGATLLLCVFHVLQQVWRWLFEKEHGIGKMDRVEIMRLFRLLVYAQSEEAYEVASDRLFASVVTRKYNNCVLYFQDLCEIKESWAECFRKEMLIRGLNTNNYVEAQFLVLKDNVLKRQRQFNINMLLDKLMNDFEDHFKLRLLSVADGTFDGIYSRRFKGFQNKNATGKFKDVKRIVNLWYYT